jgi:hypothetical protein
VLCHEKNRTIVEYALHDVSKPIGVATALTTGVSRYKLATKEKTV